MINENENINIKINQSTQIHHINNSEEYTNITKSQGKNNINVLIFMADWCGPCVRMKPFVNETILKYTKKSLLQLKLIKFLYINIDNCLSISEHFNISLLPTIIITQNNKEEYRLLNNNIDNLTEYLDNLVT